MIQRQRPSNRSSRDTRSRMASNLYASLLPKLVAILELAQKPEGAVTPQAKQALLEAVS